MSSPCARVVEMVPLRVVEIVPVAVVEIVPTAVVEIVPVAVVEIVPVAVVEIVPREVVEMVPVFADAVAAKRVVKTAVQMIDLQVFMVSPGGLTSGVTVGWETAYQAFFSTDLQITFLLPPLSIRMPHR
jgi:hypothetical protein